jgi:hypothetical protein
MPMSGFHISKKGRGGGNSWCRACVAVYKKGNRPTGLKRKAQNIKSRYGITIQDVSKIRASQAGMCKICGADLAKVVEHIDHCHKTGRVRGLLCQPCNVKLRAIDDKVWLAAAMKYVS